MIKRRAVHCQHSSETENAFLQSGHFGASSYYRRLFVRADRLSDSYSIAGVRRLLTAWLVELCANDNALRRCSEFFHAHPPSSRVTCNCGCDHSFTKDVPARTLSITVRRLFYLSVFFKPTIRPLLYVDRQLSPQLPPTRWLCGQVGLCVTRKTKKLEEFRLNFLLRWRIYVGQ